MTGIQERRDAEMTLIKKNFPPAASCIISKTKKILAVQINFKYLQNTLNEIEILKAGLQTSSALRKSDWKFSSAAKRMSARLARPVL